MAEDVPPSDRQLKKQQSKFGMMMKGMSRSAKKGMSRAGKQMAKGVVKGKMYAIANIAKAEVTPEDPEIVSALERLKITKNEIYAISDIVRNLYEARVNEATFLIQLADKLCEVRISQNDPFGSYVQSMGKGLSNLELVQSEHLKRMEEELVLPLEKFRDYDVEEVQKLKLVYKTRKAEYDLANKRLVKAQDSDDQSKIQNAQAKKDSAYTELQDLRNQMKFQVNNLEQKKQVGLLGCMEQYWSSYSAFAMAQSNILSKNSIQKDNYVAPAFEEYQNVDMEQKENGYNMDNNNNDNNEYGDNMINGNANDNNENDNDNTPSAPTEYNEAQEVNDNNNYDSNGAEMPPPPNYMDDDDMNDNEYDDENLNNGPTDDYNPFGE